MTTANNGGVAAIFTAHSNDSPSPLVYGDIWEEAEAIGAEKEPLRQQASPEWKIKNLDITYLAALLPTGLCKTQLNLSPLNSALQYIKQKILQA
ncbi:hypothetical protein GDO81_011181 [Engystomops pustulosus]|uniref:Uncharacterized protein n=1 Tax=Engystomops pustulosus TaxID=76066 RepID=A0AAV7BCL3_ENGPU|nr:hypothetical protein GDO81_011181 [Engystomops pustulosus]